VYPQASAAIATNSLDTPVIGLIGRAARGSVSAATLEQRVTTLSRSLDLSSFGLADDLAVLGSFIAGSHALTTFAGDAPFNTDDRPIVAYRAPRITYASDSRPRDRLIALLSETSIAASDVLASPPPSLDARLVAYWRARDRFIEAGRDIEPTGDVQRMLAQVREPLLDILRISPEFQPAYEPLLRMAAALSEVDARSAKELLLRLQEAQPARPESGRLLAELASRTP
jgi:spermidine synthase